MPKRKRLATASFQHSRLQSPRSIRLLNLTASGRLSAPLEVNLLEVSLDDFPSENHNYEALSYVWGSPHGSIPCTCNGARLLITPNCDEALRYLRSPDQTRMLWVDAICIDQGSGDESVKERNIQITLMGDVYRNAQRTICWIGKGEEYYPTLFDRLCRIGQCSSQRELSKLLEFDKQLRQKGLVNVDSTCLNEIFCHPWHSRIWTLQEVAFSRDCQILCGKESISWESYVAAAKFLVYEEFIDELDSQAWKNYVSIALRDDLQKEILGIHPDDDDDGKLKLLTSSLTQVRHLQATNPKDKIYGLYAMFAVRGINLPAPDYGKSLETIYEEACLSMISQSKSLQVLGYASSNARNPSLPSWVADWEDEDATLVIPPTHATNDSKISPTTLSRLSPGPGQLRIQGQIVGSITTRAENTFSTLDFPSSSLSILTGDKYHLVETEVNSLRLLVYGIRLFREWMHLVGGLQAPYPDDADEDFENIFSKLITFDFDSSKPGLLNLWVDILQYPETSYDLSYGERVAKMWKETDKPNKHEWTTELSYCAVIAAAILTKSITEDHYSPAEIHELMDFTSHVSGNMSCRALVLVHDDVLDAMLPGTAFYESKMGDSVVLLEGASYPVVLRRRGEEWTFVGPAHVMGLMDGEGWFCDEEEDGQDGQSLQDFVLV